MTESKGKSTIIVLADTPYYEFLENAMKIRKYVKQRNVNQLAKSVQDIIRDQQDEAGKYETSEGRTGKAIIGAQFYADGEHIEVTGSTASARIDDALKYLVAHVYSELDLITRNAETDADVIEILRGTNPQIAGTEDNRDAAAKVEEYLEMQSCEEAPDLDGGYPDTLSEDSIWLEGN
jgi:Ca2+-dependent lipid-binding protein